jgi:hypothetical protein
MNAETAVKVLRKVNSNDGVLNHQNVITIAERNKISNLIEQQTQYAELGRFALDALNKTGFERCDGIYDSGCPNNCEWDLFCKIRAELLVEVPTNGS